MTGCPRRDRMLSRFPSWVRTPRSSGARRPFGMVAPSKRRGPVLSFSALPPAVTTTIPRHSAPATASAISTRGFTHRSVTRGVLEETRVTRMVAQWARRAVSRWATRVRRLERRGDQGGLGLLSPYTRAKAPNPLGKADPPPTARRALLALGLDEPPPDRVAHDLYAVAHAELGQQVPAV